MTLQWLRLRLIPFLKFVGELKAPWTVKRVTGLDYFALRKLVKPGDILLTKTDGHLSNAFIPGYWKHAAILASADFVMEAVGAGVVKTDLVTFLTSKDEVVVVRAKFCSDELAELAGEIAFGFGGAAYDYEFSLGNKAFYCAELVYVCYREAAGDQMGFVPRERLGVQTVTADDFFEAKSWWQPVFDSRDKIR